METQSKDFEAAQTAMRRAFETVSLSAKASLQREQSLTVDLERSAENADYWRQQSDSFEAQLRDADNIKEQREKDYVRTTQELTAAKNEVVRVTAALNGMMLGRADEGKDDVQSTSSSCPLMYVTCICPVVVAQTLRHDYICLVVVAQTLKHGYI